MENANWETIFGDNKKILITAVESRPFGPPSDKIYQINLETKYNTCDKSKT